METIIIAKAGVTYAAKSSGTAGTINDAINLLDGAIAVYNEAGTLIAGNATSVVGNSLTFVVKRGNELKVSFPIYKDGFKTSAITYVAPVAKVAGIGSNTDAGSTYSLNLPTVFLDGQYASVTIVNTDLHPDIQTRVAEYTVPVYSDDTRATLTSRLMAKVNADTKRIVNMSKIDTTNSNGFLFTAITAGTNFTVNCGGILENADVLERTEVIFAGSAGVVKGTVAALTNLVANNPGQGTSKQIRKAERDASTHEGNNNYSGWQADLYTKPSMVVEGATYAQSVVSSNRPNDNTLIPRLPLIKQVHIAIPAGDANWAIIQNILAVFITPTA